MLSERCHLLTPFLRRVPRHAGTVPRTFICISGGVNAGDRTDAGDPTRRNQLGGDCAAEELWLYAVAGAIDMGTRLECALLLTSERLSLSIGRSGTTDNRTPQVYLASHTENSCLIVCTRINDA